MLAVEQDLEQSRKENAEMERDLERERRAKEQIESKLEIAEKERTNLRREVDSLRYILSSPIWQTKSELNAVFTFIIPMYLEIFIKG